MINGEIKGAKELEQRLNAVVPSVRHALTKAVEASSIKLQIRVIKKLNGVVLKNRTGRLMRSINFRVTGQGTQDVAGFVGTNVEYARVHEYGFKGAVTVKEHLRVQKMAWGKAMKNPRPVTVKSHSMKMNMPERSFLRSALAEMEPEINAAIEKATRKAAQEAMGK